MSIAANKAVARRFIDEVWNGGGLAVAEVLLDPKLVNHDPDGKTVGRAEFLSFIKATRAAMPDIHFTIDDMVAEGDEVVTRVTIRATPPDTPTDSPATGRPKAWSGIGIFRLADGRIVEQWADTDSIGTALDAMQPQPE
jgi:predicted ester cyclase